MNYYLSIQYTRKNPDGTIPEGFDMEEKPELEKYTIDGKKETYGWTEKNHQDKYSEVRRYLIKGYRPKK